MPLTPSSEWTLGQALTMRRNGDVDLRELPRDELQEMAEAGVMIGECYRVLAKTDDNVVGELLKGQSAFYEWDH